MGQMTGAFSRNLVLPFLAACSTDKKELKPFPAHPSIWKGGTQELD
jgi:hypothetical protein